jgi:hypothetical protein
MSDALKSYLKQIREIPLLTTDEEIELSREVQAMIALKDLQREPTQAEKRIILKGRRAKKKFIEANLRLVVSVAKKFQGAHHSLEMLDLIQEGSIGLNRAVEKFDGARGYKFSTYAYLWIKQAIQSGVRRCGSLIELPKPVKDELNKISITKEKFLQKHGRDPKLSELANLMSKSVDDIVTILQKIKYVSSLDAPLGNSKDGQPTTYSDFLADLSVSGPEALMERLSYEQEVATLLSQLPETLDSLSIDVLMSRYGEHPEPWVVIQQRTGMGRAGLKQIEIRALNRCKRLLLGLPLSPVAPRKNEPARQASIFDFDGV